MQEVGVSVITQGQGDWTEHKQRGIGAACAVSLSIFRAKFGASRWRYWHFDLNAGTGFNDQAHCIGSPIAFLRQASACGVGNFQAHFVDIQATSCAQLMIRPELVNEPRAFVHHGDNREFVLAIPEILRRYRDKASYAMGTVLVDPNDSRVPLAELETLSKQCPRLDLIINWNSTAPKRVNGAAAKGLADPMPTLAEVIERSGKSSWLIREPIGGAHGFTLLVGRNCRVGDHKVMGFHHLDSPKGRAIFEDCHFTRAQLADIARGRQASLL
jgi:hypothetical protein